jgi:hypothetical protein
MVMRTYMRSPTRNVHSEKLMVMTVRVSQLIEVEVVAPLKARDAAGMTAEDMTKIQQQGIARGAPGRGEGQTE